MSGTGPAESVRQGDKEALRALFTENIKSVYAHALSRTGEEAAAKAALKGTLRAAAEACDACPDEPLPWLCSLCDEVLGVQVSAPAVETFAEVSPEPAAEPVPEPVCTAQEPAGPMESSCEPCVQRGEDAVENAAEPVEEAAFSPQPQADVPDEAPAPAEPAAEVAAPQAEPAPASWARSEKKYDMEQDEWLNKLREEKRRALRESAKIPQEPVENCMEDPQPVENSVEDAENFPVKKPVKHLFGRIGILLLVLVILILIWALVGLLMNLDILPFRDLGYNWFNTHILDVF